METEIIYRLQVYRDTYNDFKDAGFDDWLDEADAKDFLDHQQKDYEHELWRLIKITTTYEPI
jgi:hypothetical protein